MTEKRGQQNGVWDGRQKLGDKKMREAGESACQAARNGRSCNCPWGGLTSTGRALTEPILDADV